MTHTHDNESRWFRASGPARLGWPALVLALLVVLASGCDDAGNGDPTDTGQVEPDTAGRDTVDDTQPTDTDDGDDVVDADTADDTADDTMTPPVSANGPDRAALSAGGGRLQGSTYQLELSIGAPIGANAVQGTRFQAHIGVGPYISLPDAGTESP